MSVIQRGLVFSVGTGSNAILFLFHSRVVLEVVSIANSFPDGPATSAINLVPQAILIAIGIIQVVLVAYLLGAFGQQRTAQRRPA